MGWKQQVRSYFTFNRRERKGILALLGLIALVWLVRLGLEYVPVAKPDLNVELLPAPADEQSEFAEASFQVDSGTLDLGQVDWRAFDPNAVSEEELISFGLAPHVAARWGRYREKGGRFDQPTDIAMIYGIDDAWVQAALPHVVIPTSRSEKAPPEKHPSPPEKIDLNRADTTALMSIPGIGSYYARAIVKLRDRLGGFRSYEQLIDIYQMRDEALTSLYEHSFIDTTAIQKLPLNSASLEVLGSHPYLTWKQARVLVAYRQQHGPYTEVSEIKRTQVISDSVYRNIAPYLSME